MENQENTENQSQYPVKATAALSSHMNIWMEDQPIGIKIIPSGWTEPRMYHLLIEWGDRDNTEYHFVDAEQLKADYGIEIEERAFNSYIVTPEEVQETPNDFELGNKIRTKLNVLKSNG